MFEIKSNLTVATFLKVRCEPKALLGINVAAFLLACIAQIIAIYFFGSPIAVELASLLGISTRYAIGTLYLGKVYGSQNGKMMTCLFAEMILFYGERIFPFAFSMLFRLRAYSCCPYRYR